MLADRRSDRAHLALEARSLLKVIGVNENISGTEKLSNLYDLIQKYSQISAMLAAMHRTPTALMSMPQTAAIGPPDTMTMESDALAAVGELRMANARPTIESVEKRLRWRMSGPTAFPESLDTPLWPEPAWSVAAGFIIGLSPSLTAGMDIALRR